MQRSEIGREHHSEDEFPRKEVEFPPDMSQLRSSRKRRLEDEQDRLLEKTTSAKRKEIPQRSGGAADVTVVHLPDLLPLPFACPDSSSAANLSGNNMGVDAHAADSSANRNESFLSASQQSSGSSQPLSASPHCSTQELNSWICTPPE